MWAYILVFIASFLVDAIPFVGPPAWIVMVAIQMYFGLNVWVVIFLGVIGSAFGRYFYSSYVPLLSNKFIKPEKNEDVRFIGDKLRNNGWKVQAFVLLYTLMPLPSTPLFTAAGMARIPAMNVIPAFFVGKFTSDALMVHAGDYVAKNATAAFEGIVSWQSISAILLGIILVLIFLFIDWRTLLQDKKFRMHFNIWK
ncbi:MAG: hypothetical protein JST70_05475 [Bacteroidetes bacterium]|nr:hypothetical protein [Bacteroidota bacterium]